MNKIIILLVFLLPLMAEAQEKEINEEFNPNYRTIFWLHGLGGDAYSLRALHDWVRSTYQVNSYCLGYATNNGIASAADDLNGFTFNRQQDDIVVAHSMGGLVARYYNKQVSSINQFGGLITLATPHRGAAFASSFPNGRIANLYGKTVTDGLQGYKKMTHHIKESRFHINTLIQLPIINNVIDTYSRINRAYQQLLLLNTLFTGNFTDLIVLPFVPETISNGIIDKIPEIMEGYTQQIVSLAAETVFGKLNSNSEYSNASRKDLVPNSPLLNNLNQNGETYPVVAFSCVEDYPSGIRFLGSRLSAMKQNQPAIGSNNDEEFLDLVNALVNDAELCRAEYARLFKVHSFTTLGLENDKFRDRRDRFERQGRYWYNGFEHNYQECLGSIYYTTETETHLEYMWVSNDNSNVQIVLQPFEPDKLILDEGGNQGGSMQWVVVTNTYQVEHIRPNDGICTQETQEQCPVSGQELEIVTLVGVNHEEVKTSFNTVQKLDSDCFNKRGSWFYLLKPPINN